MYFGLMETGLGDERERRRASHVICKIHFCRCYVHNDFHSSPTTSHGISMHAFRAMPAQVYTKVVAIRPSCWEPESMEETVSEEASSVKLSLSLEG